MKVKQF